MCSSPCNKSIFTALSLLWTFNTCDTGRLWLNIFRKDLTKNRLRNFLFHKKSKWECFLQLCGSIVVTGKVPDIDEDGQLFLPTNALQYRVYSQCHWSKHQRCNNAQFSLKFALKIHISLRHYSCFLLEYQYKDGVFIHLSAIVKKVYRQLFII